MDGVGRVMTVIGTGQNTWPRLAQSDATFPGHDSEAMMQRNRDGAHSFWWSQEGCQAPTVTIL